MGDMSNTERRVIKTWFDEDVHTGWRHVLCLMNQSGAAKWGRFRPTGASVGRREPNSERSWMTTIWRVRMIDMSRIKDAMYYDGYRDGYEDGKNDGYEGGSEFGHQDRYREGYGDGREAGIREGYGDGREAGRDDGFLKGYGVGREDGYNEGYIQGILDGGRRP